MFVLTQSPSNSSSPFIRIVYSQPIYLLLIYWVILSLIYFKAHPIVLTDDAFQFFVEYEKMGWGGFYQNYGFTSLYYVTHFANIVLYHIFKLNTEAWLLFFTFLHAVSSILLFQFVKTFAQQHQLKQAFYIGLFSSLWFLISPYQTEIICWVATLHYNLSMISFLGMSLFMMRHRENLSPYHTPLSLAYVFILLIMEVPLVFPFCWFLILEGFHFNPLTSKHKKLWFSFLFLIGLYFMSTKLIKGSFIPHYAEQHLSNHNVYQYALNYCRYVWKYLFLGHFIPERTRIYLYFEKWWVLWLLYGSAVGMLLVWRKKIPIPFVLKSILLSFMMLMPMINMFFMVERLNENSRLGYFFSFFIFTTAITLILLFPKVIRNIILFCVLVINFACTLKQAEDGAVAGKIYQSAIRNFPDLKTSKNYLLNLPNHYRGYYMFREVWRLESALKFFKHRTYSFIELNSINLLDANQKIYCNFETDTTIHLSHDGYGIYFMQSNYGATSRSKPWYDLQVDEWSIHETIQIKQYKKSETSFLIFEEDRFKVIPRN